MANEQNPQNAQKGTSTHQLTDSSNHLAKTNTTKDQDKQNPKSANKSTKSFISNIKAKLSANSLLSAQNKKQLRNFIYILPFLSQVLYDYLYGNLKPINTLIKIPQDMLSQLKFTQAPDSTNIHDYNIWQQTIKENLSLVDPSYLPEFKLDTDITDLKQSARHLKHDVDAFNAAQRLSSECSLTLPQEFIKRGQAFSILLDQLKYAQSVPLALEMLESKFNRTKFKLSSTKQKFKIVIYKLLLESAIGLTIGVMTWTIVKFLELDFMHSEIEMYATSACLAIAYLIYFNKNNIIKFISRLFGLGLDLAG